jgi:hypothetical protein
MLERSPAERSRLLERLLASLEAEPDLEQA